MAEDVILSVKNISKLYGAVKAVDDVSFNVQQGDSCNTQIKPPKHFQVEGP